MTGPRSRKNMQSAFTMAVLAVASCLLMPFSSVFLEAQRVEPIVAGQSIRFHSKILNEDRQLLVYVPDGYQQSSVSYPVLYVMDGETHWFHIVSTSRLFSLLGTMPKVIVVGVTNTNRARDMTPHPAMPDKDFPDGGGSAAFFSFLSDEVRPYIDGHYRSSPFSILAGTSFLACL